MVLLSAFQHAIGGANKITETNNVAKQTNRIRKWILIIYNTSLTRGMQR